MIFYLIVSRDESGRVSQIFSPDIDNNILENYEELYEIGINNYVVSKLTRELKARKFNKPPLSMDDLNEIDLDKNQSWLTVNAPYTRPKGSLGKIFGVSYITLTLIFAFLAASISLIAVIITANSASNENKQNSARSLSIGIISAIIRFVVVATVFCYSNAKNELELLGDTFAKKFNSLFCQNTEQIESESSILRRDIQSNNSCKTILAKLSVKTGAAAAVIGDQIIMGTTLYQEIIGLGTQATKNSVNIPEDLFFYYAIIVVCSSTFINCCFESSFFMGLIRDFDKWIDKKRTPQDDSQLRRDQSSRLINAEEEIITDTQHKQQTTYASIQKHY